jgi:hypothetical protein
MANRLIRNTAILLKEEATYNDGTTTPTGGTDALLVSNLSITAINAQNVDRDLIRPYLGGSEQLLGTRYVEMGFDLELAGSGTVATAPAWAPALLSCAFVQTLTATIRADYTPVSTSIKSCVIYWYDDGVLHVARGCRGNVQIMMKVGERPVASFKFTGIYSTPTAATNPAVTLTAFKTPMVVTDANTQDMTFGATHNATVAPAFVGGTSYPSQGIEIDMGNSVNFTALLGGETVDLTQRAATGKVTLDLTAAQEVTLMQAVEAGTLQTVGLLHGTVANQKVGIWLPNVQLINPAKAEANGKRLVSFDMRLVPSTAGNDEVRIITSF